MGRGMFRSSRQKEKKECANVRSPRLCEPLAVWYGYVLESGEGRWLKKEKMVKVSIPCPISA